MKKTMFTMVLMTAALSMAGCGSGSGAGSTAAAKTEAVETTAAESSQVAETTAEASESAKEAEITGFTFVAGDTVIAMNADAAPILEGLGWSGKTMLRRRAVPSRALIRRILIRDSISIHTR